MEGSRVSQAVARIETAIGRIKKAADSIPSQPAADPAAAERADALEDTIRSTLADLDRLIDGLGG